MAYKLNEDKYSGTKGMFDKHLANWKKEDKLKQIDVFRNELEAAKSTISSEEYNEAKEYLDAKEKELKENNIYKKNTMNELRTAINKLVKEELALLEKKKKKDELPPVEDIDINEPTDEEAPIDINVDMPAEEAPAADMNMGGDMSMDMSGGNASEKAIGQGLQMALDAAKQLPDGETKDKLIRQIGNTALFFLKTQIPTSGQA